jgi:hypothetical protein
VRARIRNTLHGLHIRMNYNNSGFHSKLTSRLMLNPFQL